MDINTRDLFLPKKRSRYFSYSSGPNNYEVSYTRYKIYVVMNDIHIFAFSKKLIESFHPLRPDTSFFQISTICDEYAKDVFYPNVEHPHYVATCK